MHGGELVGHGGFGQVYDNITDIVSDNDYIINKFGGEICKLENCEKLIENCVFKSFEYQKALEEEKKNNEIVYKKMNNAETMTPFNNDICSIYANSTNEEFLVYKKFQNNLQNYLFQSSIQYQREWKLNENIYPKVKSIEFIKHVIVQVLTVCAELHTHNPPIIHSDIKLDNILIKIDEKSNSYSVVLADFGIMRKCSSNFTETLLTTSFEGMVDYMPPFCHFMDNKNSLKDNYCKKMNCIFKTNLNKSKHPPIKSDINFEDVVNTYDLETDQKKKQEITNNVFQIDLHPIGIIILQLIKAFNIDVDKSELSEFAQYLMINKFENEKKDQYTARDALNEFKKKIEHKEEIQKGGKPIKNLTVSELKKRCKQRGFVKYSNLNKTGLLLLLKSRK